MSRRGAPGPGSGVALVTGASRGIGRGIATRLAVDGWTVAVNYRADESGAAQTVSDIEAVGGKAVLAQGDVADRSAVDQMFATAEEYGTVSVLVNNAGVRRDGLTAMMKPDDWHSVVQTNLDAAFHTSRRAVRAMLSKRWGRIVNVASVVGLRGNAGQANYAAAKAGLIGLTRSLAREVGSRGITVNAVAPGLVMTALTESLPQELLDGMVVQTPLGRAVTVEEVAAAVSFLVSGDASGVTGQVLAVDGGLTA